MTSFLPTKGSPLSLSIGFGLSAVLACGLFLISHVLWAGLLTLACLSGAILANGVCTQVVLQTQVPESVRGKVLSLYTMIFRGLPAMGAMAAGLIAENTSNRVIFGLSPPIVAMLLVLLVALNKDRKKLSDS
ncbi:hypothetical protein HSBAA_61780 [Vreelandella sulfidaeris]|uniref:Major facilitator superfamily (MFS) profile domain-containing protein n=1 Tax=Vreelandella sulfidaeris TaxID=115553 RepID=A0A455UF08_9GAMM|nr:hypothetical protein HSBAA_61780 [Halomonas sulfidaeris]